MPEISIIVPVYNVENYLKKCVDSILAQTYRDFELILVDDGSTDKSGKICDDYAQKDNRVVVLHKKNGGLSSARNAGIDIAKGNFLGFVDSDDYIEKTMYDSLYSGIKAYGADVAICGLCDLYNGIKVWNKNYMKKCCLDNITAFKLVLEGKILAVSAVNKLYKKELFENIRYPEGKTYEDAFVTPKLLYNANKVAYTPEIKYYYVHRGNSITTSKFKPSDIYIIEAYNEHLKFVKNNVPNLSKPAEFRYLWAHMVVMDKLIEETSKDEKLYKNILKKIRYNIFNIISSPFFSLKRKLASLVLIVSPSLYKMLLRKKKAKLR